MANTFSRLMGTQQVGIDRMVVGVKPEDPSKKPVIIKLAVFFDGTSNNRTNVGVGMRMRNPATRPAGLRQDNIDYFENKLHMPGRIRPTGLSFTRGFTNVAILELLNERNRQKKHEVSVYVEGSGSRNFVEPQNAQDPNPAKLGTINTPFGTANTKTSNVTGLANGEDEVMGLALGSGSEGLEAKTRKGIANAQRGIEKAYEPKKQYIEKIFIDAYGFSRGAAQARYFIHLVHDGGALRTGWPQKKQPQIIVNFIGLFDTVCAAAELGSAAKAAFMNRSLDSDNVFANTVKQYHLDLRGVPKQVVQLTAADEYKKNFSLVNIESSRAAGVGFELALPGSHGDSGGGSLSQNEVIVLEFDKVTKRSVMPPFNSSISYTSVNGSIEKRNFLVAGGWYTGATDEQFKLPTHLQNARQEGAILSTEEVPVALGFPVFGARRAVGRDGFSPLIIEKKRINVTGTRFIPNTYNLIPLAIIVRLANGGGKHSPTKFTDPRTRSEFRVPPELEKISARFLSQAMSLKGSKKHEAVRCAADSEVSFLRNGFLHVSSVSQSTGVEGRENFQRLIISDLIPEGQDNNNSLAARPNYAPKKASNRDKKKKKSAGRRAGQT